MGSSKSAKGVKGKVKIVKESEKKNHIKEDKVVPKTVVSKKPFKKEKVKKIEKNISKPKKELIKKSLADSQVVEVIKNVPKVLKVKNGVDKTVKSKKDSIEQTKVKEVKVEKKTLQQSAELKKKQKAIEIKTEAKTKLNVKSKKKTGELKNSKNDSTKENIKSTKQTEKNLPKSTKSIKVKVVEENKEGTQDNVKKMGVSQVSRDLSKPSSPKRKLLEAVKEEKSENPCTPPSKKEILQFVKGLLKYTEKQEKDNKNLFNGEKPPVFLQVNCIKIPKAPLHQMRTLLPHCMVRSTDDVALFVKDLKKGRRRDVEPTIHHYEDLMREHGISAITTIIPLNQVKTEYRQFEMRRKLLGSYDYFLVDGRISGHIAHMLGKTFREKRKLPTPVHMDKKDFKGEISIALRKTGLEIHSTGDSSTVQVGTCSMCPEDLADNILAVIKEIDKSYPGGLENIRSLRIKTPLDLAIPIYMNLKSRNTVQIPEQKPKRPKLYQEYEGELSTFTNDVHVIVAPDGTVKMLKNKGNKKEDSEKTDKKLLEVNKEEKNSDETEEETSEDEGSESD